MAQDCLAVAQKRSGFRGRNFPEAVFVFTQQTWAYYSADVSVSLCN